MKYLFFGALLLILAGLSVLCCNEPKQTSLPTVRDTTTGHWQYTHDEEMEWVKDSTTKQKP